MLAVISACLSSLIFSLWIIFFGRWSGKLIRSKNKSHTLPDHNFSYTSKYAFTLIGILLILVNINQVAGINYSFTAFSIASIFFIPKFIIALDKHERIDATKDFISIWGVQIFLIIIITALFRADKFWLLEGPNHDSLIYFEGITWALHNPLQVNKETVMAAWGLGTYSECGGLFIGHSCSLYRAGSYTLASWSQFFNFSITGTGLWLSGSIAGAFIWLSVRFVADSIFENTRPYTKYIFTVALLASISTGLIGTIVNSNLATTYASACIALMFSLTFTGQFRYKSILIGMLIGLSSHIYSEAMFYTGFFAFFVLLKDALNNNQKPGKVIKLFTQSSLIVFIVFLLAGNYTVYQAVRSLLFISENVQTDQPWTSWYIHGPTWYWISSFMAGDLLGGAISNPRVVYTSTCAILISLIVLLKSNKMAIAALLALSGTLVLLIELKGYQYGEHKILQLVGPSWNIFISASLLVLISSFKGIKFKNTPISNNSPIHSKYFFTLILALILTIYVSADYLKRAKRMLNSMAHYHSINFDDQNIASLISPGDIVALDDSAFSLGTEPFLKSHYAAFFIHSQGGRMVMPNISDNPLRGGYYRNQHNNTFKSADSINYLLQGKGAHGNYSIIKYDDHKTTSYPSYNLIDVNSDSVVLLSNGWHQCEISHCWTKSSFETEAFIKNENTLIFEIDYFYPPENGTVNVYIDGVIMDTLSTQNKYITVKLPHGYHNIKIDSGWDITTPKDMNISEDNRKLFAMVKSIRLSTPINN